jgi:hypothetical protein
LKKLYEENDIKSIATSIRAKTGKSDAMKVSEMSGEIDSLHAETNALIQRTISGVYKNSDITVVGNRSLSYLPGVTKFDLPNVTRFEEGGLMYNKALTKINAPKLTWIGESALRYCSALTSVPTANVTLLHMYCLAACTALKTVDVSVATYVRSYSLNGSGITSLILRYNSVSILQSTNALTDTPIASGTGYIYVPSSIIDSYKATTNWSVYADQFRALEDYTVDGTTTGELDESKI